MRLILFVLLLWPACVHGQIPLHHKLGFSWESDILTGVSDIRVLQPAFALSGVTRVRMTYRGVGLSLGLRQDALSGKVNRNTYKDSNGIHRALGRAPFSYTYFPFSFQIGWMAEIPFRSHLLRLEYMHYQPQAAELKPEDNNVYRRDPLPALQQDYHVHGMHMYFKQRTAVQGGSVVGFVFAYHAAEEFTGANRLWLYTGVGVGVEVGNVRPKGWGVRFE